MDGEFVPQKMGSIALTNEIAKSTQRQLWLHLMVKDPVMWLAQLNLRPGDVVSAHYTTLNGALADFLAVAEQRNIEPSLAISPSVPIQDILPLCRQVSHVLVMSVEPGKAGQKFLPETLSKISELVTYRGHQEISLTIGVDGGVNGSNMLKLKSLGVSCVAMTSALFDTPDPLKTFKSLNQLLT